MFFYIVNISIQIVIRETNYFGEIKMKKPQNRAKLNFNEAIVEIHKRTGLPENSVYRVLWTYAEVIKECLCNQVEIAFADIGTFGYQHHCERHDVKYYNPKERRWMPPMYQPPYDAPVFRNTKPWKKQMREATIPFYYDEETGELKEIEYGVG